MHREEEEFDSKASARLKEALFMIGDFPLYALFWGKLLIVHVSELHGVVSRSSALFGENTIVYDQ